MLSQAEYQYVYDLIINYYNQGYKNYFCITNTPVDYNSNNFYDISCFVSKDDMKLRGENLTIYSGKYILIDSNNRSTNNTIAKLVISDINNELIKLVDRQEFSYSNIEGFPDITGTYRTSLNNHLDLNFAYLIPCLLMLLFVVTFVRSCFRSRRG